MLPAEWRVVRTAPVAAGWGSGTAYTLELPASDSAGGATAYEEHVILRDGPGGAYDFFSRAATAEEARLLHFGLRRMYTSAEVDPVAPLEQH
ncbi:MAG: hypothetical protein H0X65_14845 [Gemmatimonadetes bacterium]|jgi:hypothetical protein|nr:hypothetical protein [Gemmatimonadota bacterium]